jgi:high-affinity iron transporter
LNGGGGWGIFNALFGWTNSATYGTVISYNLYWIAVIIGFVVLRFRESKGHWPFMKAPVRSVRPELKDGAGSDRSSDVETHKKEPIVKEGELEKSHEVVG